MGFKVMVWVCPYIRPDGKEFTELLHDETKVVWLRSAKDPRAPAIVRWWDGFSAVTDHTSPDGRAWFKAQLDRLVEGVRRRRVQARRGRRRALRRRRRC